MATLPCSSSSKTLTLSSPNIFLESYRSFSQTSPPPQTSPPLCFSLLSQQSPLPRIPTDNFPQSKLIPKTRFIVDGFRNSGDYSISYFLSHFHSDHYAGLNPSWSRGLIFCSEITARLLIQVLNISPFFVVSLSLGESAFIDECEVILIDAGHCPGAVQFLFKIPEIQGTYKRYVHTGDFRFCSSMKLEPKLSEFVGADAIFLDTTYCNPKFCFPSQTESVEYIVKTIARIRDENKGLEKSVLFLIATYVVGKERILVEVSQKCNCLIHVDSRKMEILRALALGEKECGIFTEDASLSDVHVIGWNILGETWPYFRPNYTQMKEIMVERGYSKAVGFVPTGWMYEMKRHGFSERSKDSFEIHLVPYSEHSSYDELREYVRFLKPKCVIPTVGIDVEKLDSKHVIAMRKHFSGLVDEMANKKEFLKGFHQRSVDTDQMEANDFNVDLSKVLTKEKEVNLLNKFSENQNNTLPDFVLGTKCSFNERGSEDSDVLNEKHTEELVQEIQDLLPVTISQDQKLDMLSTSHGSIVEAVSDCYECNTEFHEQVVACRTSSAISQRSSLSASSLLTASSSASLPELVPDKGNSHGSVRCTSSEKKQSLNIEPSLTNTVSARKRGPALQSKANKKGKASPTLEPTGSKQSTITKFFSKLAPNASQVHAVGNASTTGQYPSNDILLPHDAVEPYREELDLFLQVVGDSVSTEHAASILAKTNGDINLALDAYYSSGCEISNKEETVAFRSKLAQAQSVNECSGGNLKDFSKTKSVSSLSVHGLSPCNVDSNLVSLPLDRYSPVEHACWNAGQPAPYLHLARTFDLMEGERGKIKAAGLLCNMFRSLLVLSPEDLLPAVYLCTNKIAAAHENMELNIGGSIVTAALEEACGTNRSKIREMYNKLGDLGDVAQLCRQTQLLLAPPCALSIQEVFSVLRKISLETGNGSTARKKNLIVNLMRSCREKEIKFLVRTLVRNLRIGAMMRTVLPALAQSIVINSSPDCLHEGGLKEKLQSVSAAVVEAYNILPSLDMLVPSLLKEGIEFSSSTLSMTPGIPIKPMLARITNGVSEALKRFQGRAFTCEYKYDGQRAQIHKLVDGSVRIFSRNGDETTFRFPDVVNIIKESCKPAARTFIVDAEVVAVDRKNGCKLMSFQELSSREKGSKSSIVSVDSIKVDICVFVFDVMFANGEQLLSFPLRRRRQYLKDLFLDEKFGYFEYAKQITVESDDRCLNSEATLVRISSFFEDAFNSSCEGIMVKSLDVDAGYVASKRTDSWLKVKRDYLEGLNDSLDLVPIGAWHGNGRKAGWYSPFLMACYNPDTEEFQSVCRVMSGFSDSFYSEMKEFYTGEKILSKKPPYYQTAEVPDRWFSPELVWEIRGADFTISPVHQAAIGLVHPSRGISVRFPRFVRSVSDRRAEDCSTSEDVANMFQSQTRKMDVKMED